MSCVKKVRETLSGLADVEKVEVDFAGKKATVTVKAGKSLDKDTVVKALKAKGYGVTAFDLQGAGKKPPSNPEAGTTAGS